MNLLQANRQELETCRTELMAARSRAEELSKACQHLQSKLSDAEASVASREQGYSEMLATQRSHMDSANSWRAKATALQDTVARLEVRVFAKLPLG